MENPEFWLKESEKIFEEAAYSVFGPGAPGKAAVISPKTCVKS